MMDKFEDGDNNFDPMLSLLICHLLKNDIQMLNDRIDRATEPTYICINGIYFYNIILALHINENVRYIKKYDMPVDDFVHIIKRDTYLKMNGGKDICE